MSQNRLLIAVVLLFALGGLLVVTMRSHQPQTSVAVSSASLPSIEKAEVTALEIDNPRKQQSVVIQKQESGWQMTAPVTAKADQASVDSILEKLDNLQVASVAATRKEHHEKLEIDAKQAIRVKAKAGDKLLADLYIGASKSGGTMVRQADADQVLATKGSIRYAFDREVKDLRDRVITNLDPKDLTGLAIASEKGKFVFEKAEDSWVQAKGEKPIKKFSDAEVKSLAASLARLRAVNFADPDATAESTGLAEPAATATLTKKDGGQVTLALGKQHDGKDYYLKSSESDVIYRISKYTGDRMQPDAETFVEDEKKANDGAGDAPKPIAGGGDLPPEILEQLKGLKHP